MNVKRKIRANRGARTCSGLIAANVIGASLSSQMDDALVSDVCLIIKEFTLKRFYSKSFDCFTIYSSFYQYIVEY